jgi:osmotically-inducible protein OsmY
MSVNRAARKGNDMVIGRAKAVRWAARTLLAAAIGSAATLASAQTVPGIPEQEAIGASSRQDLQLAEQVRATLMADLAMEGIQLLVRVLDGTVEMLGIARDQAQAERAVSLALDIPGVNQVVHHIEVEGMKPTGLRV